ncbi:MAG: NTP transferase domain-containing protein [Oscillochloris sp.]|nr:NTP transferase domain-containing protein [Oscillochloris sp.]
MEAVLLATEDRRELAGLTDRRPQALLPIAGRPLLGHLVANLARAEIRRIILCSGRRGSALMKYAGDGDRWGVEIRHLTAPPDLGGGGVLRWLAPCLSGPALVIPVDRLLMFEPPTVPDMFARIDDQTALTLKLASGDQSLATGVYGVTPAMLQQLPAGNWDLERDLPVLLEQCGIDVQPVVLAGYLNRLQSLAEYQQAQHDLLERASLAGREVMPGIWVGRGTTIHPSARLTAPAFIGAGCRIGSEVEIGPSSVIGDYCVIDDGATVSASTLLPRSYIGRLTYVRERIVDHQLFIDPVYGTVAHITDPLLLGAVETEHRRSSRLIERLVALVLLCLIAPLLLLIGLLLALNTRRLPFRYGTYIGVRADADPSRREPGELRLLEFRLLHRDGKLSAVGTLLWKLEIHRLPRLWNVVTGALALVGVRPLAPQEAEQLSEDWQRMRYTRPAGFTGLWYVQPPPAYDLDAIVTADVYYAVAARRRDSLLIVLRALPAWVRRRRRSEAHEPLVYLSEQFVS